MSQVTRFVEVIPASGRIDRPRGNFFLLLASTVTLNVLMERDGTSEQFNSVTGGIRVRRVKPWNAMTIFGAAGGTVEFFFGADEVAFKDPPRQRTDEESRRILGIGNQSRRFLAWRCSPRVQARRSRLRMIMHSPPRQRNPSRRICCVVESQSAA